MVFMYNTVQDYVIMMIYVFYFVLNFLRSSFLPCVHAYKNYKMASATATIFDLSMGLNRPNKIFVILINFLN